MAYQTFEVTISDHIAHLRLNRPTALNAMNAAFWSECAMIFDRIDADPKVRVVVLSAAGRHFSAGIDLDFLAQLAPDAKQDPARGRDQLCRRIGALQTSFSRVANCRVPVLAAIQGACMGAGVDLAAACDVRYATADAYFCIQEVNIGMVADLGTLQRMPLQIPQGLMRELAYTGRKFPALEAREAGFVNAVKESHEALLDHVMGIAAGIAAKSPLAVTGTKQVLSKPMRHEIEDGLDYVAAWNAGQMSLEDVAKGAKAALAKSSARFDDLLD